MRKHSTYLTLHLRLLHKVEQSVTNRSWNNWHLSKLSWKGAFIRTADTIGQRHPSLTLIPDKITKHIRQGALIQCNPAPPNPLLDEANELEKPVSESDTKGLALKRPFLISERCLWARRRDTGCIQRGTRALSQRDQSYPRGAN